MPQKINEIISNINVSSLVVLLDCKLPIALCYGFFKPKIYLSTGLIDSLTNYQLEAVVLHELHHLQSKHMFLGFINELIASLLFFLPILKYITKNVRYFFEIASDQFVANVQKTDKYLREAKFIFTENPNSFEFALVPSFSSVMQLKFDKSVDAHKRYLVSTFVSITFLITLLLLPSNAFADNHKSISTVSTCENYQCSTHCIRSIDRETETESSNLNYTPVASE